MASIQWCSNSSFLIAKRLGYRIWQDYSKTSLLEFRHNFSRCYIGRTQEEFQVSECNHLCKTFRILNQIQCSEDFGKITSFHKLPRSLLHLDLIRNSNKYYSSNCKTASMDNFSNSNSNKTIKVSINSSSILVPQIKPVTTVEFSKMYILLLSMCPPFDNST